MVSHVSHVKSGPDYKTRFPSPSYYNLESYTEKEQLESPCMSSFWRKIPIRINWIKVFSTIYQENTIIEDHDEKPDEPEEEGND
jgi:hypothetical protein